MCFSAEASFGAAAILGVGGFVALKKTAEPKQIMFAAIPLIFALQQVCEGLLWLFLTNVDYTRWQMLATYGFLFFAQILWTTWMPVSFILLENNRRRKRLLFAVALTGIFASLMLAYRLVVYNVFPEIKAHHICYIIESPQFIITDSSILYVLVIILPPFISSVKHMKPLGIILAASLLITKIFYEEYLISVWCFFAALISVSIIYMMNQFQKPSIPPATP